MKIMSIKCDHPDKYIVCNTHVESDRCQLFGYFFCTEWCRNVHNSTPSKDTGCTTDVGFDWWHVFRHFCVPDAVEMYIVLHFQRYCLYYLCRIWQVRSV